MTEPSGKSPSDQAVGCVFVAGWLDPPVLSAAVPDAPVEPGAEADPPEVSGGLDEDIGAAG